MIDPTRLIRGVPFHNDQVATSERAAGASVRQSKSERGSIAHHNLSRLRTLEANAGRSNAL
jgi:hypothetical protein